MPLYVHLRQALMVFLLFELSSKATAAPLHESIGTIAYAPAAPEVQAKPSLVETISFSWKPLIMPAGYEPEKSSTGQPGTFTKPQSLAVPTSSSRHNGPYNNQSAYNPLKATGSGGLPPHRAVASPGRQAKVYKIMPLGDSNTEGVKSSFVEIEDRVAYRDALEELLDASRLKGLYDFVGSESTGSAHMNDTNHAGFGGARDEDIATLLANGEYSHYGEYMRGPGAGPYLDQYNPDVILLHIGTNWVWDNPSDVSDVADILNQIDAYEAREKKEVTVILAKIILTDGQDPGLDAATKTYNDNVRKMAESRVRNGDRIVFVDMQDGAGLIYKRTEAGGDMADQLHPNKQGYDKMAAVWFEALQEVITPDTQAPETKIEAQPAAASSSSSATFRFSSDEDGVIYEVSIDNAAFAQATSPYTVTGLADGEHTFQVRAVDAAGNTDNSPATRNWLVDTRAPEAPVFTGISEDRGPDGNDRVTADNTIRIAGRAEASAVVRITEEGEELGRTTASAAGNWEFNHESTSLTQGTYRFAASATDAAGNASAASAAFAVTIDLTAPEVSITKAADAPLNAPFSIEIEFTEEVYNLTAADFEVTNGVLNNLSALDRGTHTATVTPAADGRVQVVLPAGKSTDLAGNPNRASNLLETTYDATRPQLILTSDAPAAVNAPFTVTFTFSEAVSGFDVSDIAVTNGAAGNFNTINTKTYTARVRPGADGEVGIRVAAGKASDAAKNGNEASATLKRIYDVQRPAVVLSTTAPNPTNSPFIVTVIFSEPVKDFAAGDLNLTNANVSQPSKTDDQIYTVLVSPVASGEVAVAVGANAVQDMATNGNQTSNELRLRYDADRPMVTAGTSAPARTNAPFTVTFRISEAITGFDPADIARSNATAENLQKVSEQEYTVLITPTSDGRVTVSVPADKMQDAATNGNTASNVVERTYDVTAPAGYTVQFGVERVDVTNQDQVALQIEGAETGATYAYSISSSNGGEPVIGTAQVAAASFSVPGLDLTDLRDGQLTASLYLTDALGNKGPEATAQVEKLTKNIELVQALTPIKVPFKTAFKDVPLPREVEVTYTSGEKEEVNVAWEEGTYNASVPGSYTLVGVLELKENTSNLGNRTASITVEVAPNQPPTALTLSQDTFEPNIEPFGVIGAFSTTDPDDADFTYALVAGKGDAHNQLFEISNGNELTLKSNRGLSGVATFTVRVRSTDPYANHIEKTFTLTKSPYQPQSKIKLVNAFSPDGDGTNDNWTVPELRYYNAIEVEVFDRAGVRLFHTTDPEEGWDGRGADGRILQGPYFYIIQIKDINLVQKGVLTVLK